jgi:DNA processing protein
MKGRDEDSPERMTGIASELRTPSGLLALQRLPRIGPTTALRAALRAQPPAAVSGDFDALLAQAMKWADDLVRKHLDAGVEVITFFDDRYPPMLSEIADPPPILYVRGSLHALHHERLLAVVGTREPSRFGETAAAEIVARAAEAGWGIVSGLALGIDTIAHEASLKSGAPTVAILGNGLDRTYPKANTDLADAILASGGAVIGELPFGSPPIARNLIARDRLQSGMSRALVIAQSAAKGGAMHTARFAAEQGRPIFCPVPHGENGKSEGLKILLERSAIDLPGLLPAWRDATALCARLGRAQVARPIERETVDEFIDALDRLLAEPASNAQQALVIPELNA